LKRSVEAHVTVTAFGVDVALLIVLTATSNEVVRLVGSVIVTGPPDASIGTRSPSLAA